MVSAKRRYPLARWTSALGGGKPPLRPPGAERVGGRADPAAGDEEGAVGPQIGAEAVGGERQVVVEADRHLVIARSLLRALQLQSDLPLQVLVKHHRAPVFLAERAGGDRKSTR